MDLNAGENADLVKAHRKLKLMVAERLQKLLESDDNKPFDAILDKLPHMRILLKQRDELQKKVTNLANFNYACEPQFTKDRLKLVTELGQVTKLQKKICINYVNPLVPKLDDLLVTMRSKCKDTEKRSSNLAESFLNNELDIENFLKTYIEVRKQAVESQVICNRFDEELNQLHSLVDRTLVKTRDDGNKSRTESPVVLSALRENEKRVWIE